jgi:2-oxoglutarate dehydrogenase E2 component (dihydrolipoamide succinyltransferase)
MAKVDVIMPQMGESIAEGTITRWMKEIGDAVERDEPIFEISTDKVDAEIPAPTAGVLAEIKVQAGETVEVDTVVAVLETDKDAALDAAPAAAAPEPKAETPAPAPAAAAPAPAAAPPVAAAPAAAGQVVSLEERRRTRSSPVVRKIAAEHGIDIQQLSGTGIQGRVTKRDILGFIEAGASAGSPAATAQAAPLVVTPAAPAAHVGTPGMRETMSVMRKKIAEHMVHSRQTSAHVTTLFEIDLEQVAQQRKAKGAEFLARNGVKLTYTPIIAAATIAAIKDFPILNASIDGDDVVYHQQVNLGVAVALDWGLIVPVVRSADEKNLVGLARAITDVAERARTKKLNPDEVQGGTFTITNPGVYGGLFGTPIINQPQVAILGVGGVEKRPVVVNDAIAIHTMCYLGLSYDHRLIDGAVADQFMANLKARLQNYQV